MGQRHQVFVIAKINGRYRGLACVHHQWLYGFTVLETCRRLLQILQCAENAHLLKLELTHASRLLPSAWEENPDQDEMPEFPFITTCLLAGMSLDHETNYISHAKPMPWKIDFDKTDNDDGITIFDITDLSCIRHCFVYPIFQENPREGSPVSGEEESSTVVSMHMVPLLGSEYLRMYVEDLVTTPEMRQVSAQLDNLSLIDIDTLYDAWPRDDWCSRAERNLPASMCAPLNQQVDDFQRGSKTLTEQAMDMVVHTLLREEHKLQYEVEDLPGFIPHLRAYLNLHADAVENTPFGFDLLQTAYRGSTDLSLQGFPFLTADQVLILVRNASKNLKTLDISGNRNMSVEHLTLFPGNTEVDNLYIWDSNISSLSDIRASHQGRKLGNIYARDDFLAAFHEIKAWAHSPWEVRRTAMNTRKALRGFTEPASKRFAESVLWVVTEKTDNHPNSPGEQISSPRHLFQNHTTVFGAAIPLEDTYLTPDALIYSITKCMGTLSREFLSQPRLTIIEIFAFGLALRDPKSTYAIESLPAELYKMVRTEGYRSSALREMPFETNKNTIVVVQELEKGTTLRFRIAYVSMNEDDTVCVRDLPTALAEEGAHEAARIWADTTGALQGVEVVACDEVTVQNLVRNLKEAQATKDNRG